MVIRHRKLAQHRGRPALGPLSLAALLILQQGLAFGGEISETPKLATPLNLAGAANGRTTPEITNLPTNAVKTVGVETSIPNLEVGTGVAAQGVNLQNPGAQAVGLEGASAGLLVSSPVSAATPETNAPAAVEIIRAGADKSAANSTQAGVQVLAKELESQKKSGGVGAFFGRFFDRRAKTNAETGDAVPVAGTTSTPAPLAKPTARRKFVEFNAQYLRDIKSIFNESKTKPNKQDYVYLVTKTFGVNLIIRTIFAVKGVHAGQLGVARAILSTGWYQIQDAAFTIFGQTYMKFLGKMTPMLRIGPAKLGDLLFVYVQLVASEFINRLVLGPLGENPLVYSWHGIGLLLLNNLQGMISGGLIVPVINKMKAAGVIGEKTSSNLYQLASLTMHLGLLATFGYQHLFTVLTTILMVLSWAAYIGFSFWHKDKGGATEGGKL